MKLITGQTLKAAAREHGYKQALAMGAKIPQSEYRVSFYGNRASAAWKERSFEPRRKGEKTKTVSAVTAKISYPALADNARLSRAEADIFSAYTLHEIGHVSFTSMASVKKVIGNPKLFPVMNGLEDARMEQTVIQSGLARGAKSLFKKLLNYLTGKVSADFNPTRLSDAAFALSVMGRARLGNGNHFARQLLGRIPEPKQTIYRIALDRLANAPLNRNGTDACIEIARDFLARWQEAEAAVQNNKSTAPQELKNEQGEERGPDESKGPSGPDESAESEKASENSENSEISESTEPAGFKAPDENDESDGRESDGSSNEPYCDVGPEPSGTPIKSPEPDVSDLAERINSRLGEDAAHLPDYVPASEGKLDAKNYGRPEHADPEAAHSHLTQQYPAGLAGAIRKLLTAPERCGWDAGAYSGRFDRKRQHRLASGSEAVFRRRWETEGIDTFLSITVDMSSSMRHEVKDQETGAYHMVGELALRAAYMLSQAAESAGCPVEVTGFTTWSSPSLHQELDNMGLPREEQNKHLWPDADTYILHGVVNMAGSLLRIKGEHERTKLCATRFVRAEQRIFGGTPDYPCVRTLAEQAAVRSEARKLIIVLTDGCGNVKAMQALTRHSRELMGVEIIGIALGYKEPQTEEEKLNDEFSVAYHVGAYCPDIAMLPHVLAKALTRIISRENAKRRTM